MIVSILIAIITLITTIYLCRRHHASIIPGMAIVMCVMILGGIVTYATYNCQKPSFGYYVSEILIAFNTVVLPIISALTLFVYAFAVLEAEKVTLSHKMAFVVGVLILAAEIVLLRRYKGPDNDIVAVVAEAICYASDFIPAMLIAYWLSTQRYKIYRNRHTENRYDYISVLGYRLDGEKMSPILINRLDKAFGYWERHGRCLPFYLSGGKCFAGTITEASAMREYLIEKGVPDELIHLESASRSTFENLRNISQLVGEGKKDVHCLIVTSGFHILRAVTSAEKVGIHADAISAPVPKKDRLYHSLMSREMMAFVFGNPYLVFIFVETAILIYVLLYAAKYLTFTIS